MQMLCSGFEKSVHKVPEKVRHATSWATVFVCSEKRIRRTSCEGLHTLFGALFVNGPNVLVFCKARELSAQVVEFELQTRQQVCLEMRAGAPAVVLEAAQSAAPAVQCALLIGERGAHFVRHAVLSASTRPAAQHVNKSRTQRALIQYVYIQYTKLLRTRVL